MAENKLASPKSILTFVIILFVAIASLSVASYLASVKNTPPIVVQSTEEPIITPTPNMTEEPVVTPVPSITPEPSGIIGKTMIVTIMVPKEIDKYEQVMIDYVNEGTNGKDPSETWPFVKKQVTVPYATDIVFASAEAAAEEIPSSLPAKKAIGYLKVKNKIAYVLLDSELPGNAWAGAGFLNYKIEPLVRKTLLQFSEIEKVVFDFSPDDSTNNK